ncbi:S-receptor-like serine/threonine-protein kinase protein [Dioscorea alata]|uniref:S-receptor-like serine/threonine-protein kinase protein n=1 Tax=Dioscorea alata TaxID=55571 RepID=A0ACB7VNH8_DIOAL|nr:S-receptor-like serine/threonine-protein kinase protein [Dioscorea alata]
MEAKSNKSFSFLILISISILSHLSSATDTLYLGQSLSGNQTLVSQAGTFELGFFSPGNSINYYIGIWYKNIPTRDIIWVANRETPISNPSTSELKISELDGHLVLLNQSKLPVWSSNSTLSNTTGTRVAVLLDTGNLVLRNVSNSSTSTWQSFDHPTDTWMPGGWLGVNKVTGEFNSMTSWKTPEDPAPGPYTERMDPDGSNQYVFLYNNLEVYWSSGVWNGQYFGAVPGTREKTALMLSFVDGEVWKYATYTVTVPSVIARFVIDSSGQGKTWLWLNSSQQWQQIYTMPVAHCDVPSFCGAFAVCDERSSSSCSCYTGFQPASPHEWDSGEWVSGCVRRTRLQCSSNNTNGGDHEKDGFLEMQNVKLPSNPESINVSSAEECKSACVNNCSCTAYTYDTTCSIWQGDLRSLQQLYGGDTIVGGTLYLRLAASDLPSSSSSHKWVLAVVLSIVALLGLIFFVILGTIWLLRRMRKRGGSIMSGEGSLLHFTYTDLQHITKNFSEKLGGGGFGSVFKGTMPDSTTIAVKKLEGLRQGEKQFRAEVSTMGSIQHINLLRLRGFCCEGINRLLVYDYMSGGSLDNYLSPNSKVLDWSTRYRIILGIARGIAYLHEKCRECIIHCDIKPGNILLDAESCAKVADFGMAKLLGREFSRVLTTMRGTVGYLAPEWISGLPITPKVDVYSFGMMLFEIVSGQRNSSNSKSETFFPIWAAQRVTEGEIICLLDDRLKGDADMEELMRVCRTACWCIQEQELDRPSMGQVVLVLEGVLEVNTPPIPKTFQRLMQDDQQVPHFYNPLPITEHKEQSGNSEASVVSSQNDP